jgi:hypothetical protein
MTKTANLQGTKLELHQASPETTVNGFFDLIDSAVAGRLALSLNGGTRTLTTTEACNGVFDLSGTLGSNQIVELPSGTSNGRTRFFVVKNSTSGAFTLTFRYQGGTGVVIPQGYAQALYHDGTNVYPVGLSTSTSGLALTSGLAVRAYNTANLSVGSGSATALTFSSERRDDGGLHDTSSNTDRLTAQADGWYFIWGNTEFAVSGTGVRALSIRLNVGATVIANQMIVAQGTYNQPVIVSCLYYLSTGDYVRLFAFQDSGGSLNVLASGNYSPEFGMVKVG